MMADNPNTGESRLGKWLFVFILLLTVGYGLNKGIWEASHRIFHKGLEVTAKREASFSFDVKSPDKEHKIEVIFDCNTNIYPNTANAKLRISSPDGTQVFERDIEIAAFKDSDTHNVTYNPRTYKFTPKAKGQYQIEIAKATPDIHEIYITVYGED